MKRKKRLVKQILLKFLLGVGVVGGVGVKTAMATADKDRIRAMNFAFALKKAGVGGLSKQEKGFKLSQEEQNKLIESWVGGVFSPKVTPPAIANPAGNKLEPLESSYNQLIRELKTISKLPEGKQDVVKGYIDLQGVIHSLDFLERAKKQISDFKTVFSDELRDELNGVDQKVHAMYEEYSTKVKGLDLENLPKVASEIDKLQKNVIELLTISGGKKESEKYKKLLLSLSDSLRHTATALSAVKSNPIPALGGGLGVPPPPPPPPALGGGLGMPPPVAVKNDIDRVVLSFRGAKAVLEKLGVQGVDELLSVLEGGGAAAVPHLVGVVYAPNYTAVKQEYDRLEGKFASLLAKKSLDEARETLKAMHQRQGKKNAHGVDLAAVEVHKGMTGDDLKKSIKALTFIHSDPENILKSITIDDAAHAAVAEYKRIDNVVQSIAELLVERNKSVLLHDALTKTRNAITKELGDPQKADKLSALDIAIQKEEKIQRDIDAKTHALNIERDSLQSLGVLSEEDTRKLLELGDKVDNVQIEEFFYNYPKSPTLLALEYELDRLRNLGGRSREDSENLKKIEEVIEKGGLDTEKAYTALLEEVRSQVAFDSNLGLKDIAKSRVMLEVSNLLSSASELKKVFDTANEERLAREYNTQITKHYDTLIGQLLAGGYVKDGLTDKKLQEIQKAIKGFVSKLETSSKSLQDHLSTKQKTASAVPESLGKIAKLAIKQEEVVVHEIPTPPPLPPALGVGVPPPPPPLPPALGVGVPPPPPPPPPPLLGVGKVEPMVEELSSLKNLLEKTIKSIYVDEEKNALKRSLVVKKGRVVELGDDERARLEKENKYYESRIQEETDSAKDLRNELLGDGVPEGLIKVDKSENLTIEIKLRSIPGADATKRKSLFAKIQDYQKLHELVKKYEDNVKRNQKELQSDGKSVEVQSSLSLDDLESVIQVILSAIEKMGGQNAKKGVDHKKAQVAVGNDEKAQEVAVGNDEKAQKADDKAGKKDPNTPLQGKSTDGKNTEGGNNNTPPAGGAATPGFFAQDTSVEGSSLVQSATENAVAKVIIGEMAASHIANVGWRVEEVVDLLPTGSVLEGQKFVVDEISDEMSIVKEVGRGDAINTSSASTKNANKAINKQGVSSGSEEELPLPKTGIWSKISLGSGKQEKNDTVSAFNTSNMSFSGGLDLTFAENIIIGAAISHNQSRVTSEAKDQNAIDLKATMFSIYSAARLKDRLILASQVGGGLFKSKTDRDLQLSSKFAALSLKYGMSIGNGVLLAPKANIDFINISSNKSLHINGKKLDDNTLSAGMTLGLSKKFKIGDGGLFLTPEIHGGFSLVINGKEKKLNIEKALTNNPERGTKYMLGGSFKLEGTNKLELDVGYDYTGWKKFGSHQGYLQVKLKF